MDDIINNAKLGFKKAIDHLHDELGLIQTGRASSALVDSLMIDSYGSKQPLKNVASISIPDPKLIQIQPWDKSMLGPIEKAILESNININPLNDGVVIRVPMPDLTAERRTEYVKLANKKGEDAKITIRNVRQDALRKMENGEYSEDEVFKMKKGLQDAVDTANTEVQEITSRKEKTILSI